MHITTCHITLSHDQIETALSELEGSPTRGPLKTYAWLQAHYAQRDVTRSEEFQRTFNGFYRIQKRDRTWRDHFYALFEEAKRTRPSFEQVLCKLYTSTGQYEASFVSKLVATIDPNMPVIDSKVFENLGLRLPTYGSPHRAERIVKMHDTLRSCMAAYLSTEDGQKLVQRFRERYPQHNFTETKMLDFVLWKAPRSAT